MAIRKTGSVTGEVTGVEHPPLPGLTPISARDRERFQREAARVWNSTDERELAAEDDDAPVQS